MDPTGAVRAVFWAWAVAHVLSCVWCAYAAESDLRGEARLLIERVCSTPRGYSVGSSIIRCDEARAILGAGPLPLVVFERAGRTMLVDALAAARREISALLRMIGLFGAFASALLIVARALAQRLSVWRQEDREKDCSDMCRAKQSMRINMPEYVEETQ